MKDAEKLKRKAEIKKSSKAFGIRLQEYRIAKGWSQAQLAAEAGCEKSYVSRLENGNSNPQLESYERLINAMHADYGEFSNYDRDEYAKKKIIIKRPYKKRKKIIK